jgi:hypothetical protein
MMKSDEIYYILTLLRKMKQDRSISSFKFCYDGTSPVVDIYVTPIKAVDFIKVNIMVRKPEENK